MYAVKCDPKTGIIYVGVLSKDKTKITRAQAMSGDVLAAARDHLLVMSQKQEENTAYCWPLENGNAIMLQVKEVEHEAVKEDPEEEAPAEEPKLKKVPKKAGK